MLVSPPPRGAVAAGDAWVLLGLLPLQELVCDGPFLPGVGVFNRGFPKLLSRAPLPARARPRSCTVPGGLLYRRVLLEACKAHVLRGGQGCCAAHAGAKPTPRLTPGWLAAPSPPHRARVPDEGHPDPAGCGRKSLAMTRRLAAGVRAWQVGRDRARGASEAAPALPPSSGPWPGTEGGGEGSLIRRLQLFSHFTSAPWPRVQRLNLALTVPPPGGQRGNREPTQGDGRPPGTSSSLGPAGPRLSAGGRGRRSGQPCPDLPNLPCVAGAAQHSRGHVAWAQAGGAGKDGCWPGSLRRDALWAIRAAPHEARAAPVLGGDRGGRAHRHRGPGAGPGVSCGDSAGPRPGTSALSQLCSLGPCPPAAGASTQVGPFWAPERPQSPRGHGLVGRDPGRPWGPFL